MPDEYSKLALISDTLGISMVDVIRTFIRKSPIDKDKLLEWINKE
jgi:hypothetical protein